MKESNFYKKTIVAQIVLDYFCIVLSFALGYLVWWRFVRPDTSFMLGNYLQVAFVYGVVFIIIFWLLRLYEPELSILNVEQLRRLIRGWIIGSGLLFTLGFLSKELSFSRLTFVFAIVFLFFIMVIQRGFTFRLWQNLHRKGLGVHRAVIVGAGEAGVNLFNILIHSPWLGIVPQGFIDNDKREIIGKDKKVYSVLGGLDQLEKIIDLHEINQVIVTDARLSAEQLNRITWICENRRIKTSVVPHFYNVLIQRLQVENLLGIPLLSINVPKTRWFYHSLKRLLDIIISLLVLVCLSPVIVVCALLIRLGSSGPVFFIQERVGQQGKIFRMIKFRSMQVDAKKYEECPDSLNDPRITKIGRFLRRTSLDELPQFVNVLKGGMSIVGPRPEMPFIVAQYNDLHKERLKVKPGITGLWQISHQRGSSIHENIDYDLYYIENQSFTLDLAVILGTLYSTFKGIGAW